MDKPLSQERLSESDIRVIEHDLFGVTRIIKDRVFHEMYANSRKMSIKLLSEVKRLQAIEAERDNFKLGLDSIGLVAFGELKSGTQNKAIETVCRLVYEFIEGVNAK